LKKKIGKNTTVSSFILCFVFHVGNWIEGVIVANDCMGGSEQEGQKKELFFQQV
jgi:hypothetical protein